MQQAVWIADQQKAGKQDRDDFAKLQICRVGLNTEQFDAVIPTLFSCFLLICHPYILLQF